MLAFVSSFVAAVVLSRPPSLSTVDDHQALRETADRQIHLRPESRAQALVLGVELAVVQAGAIDRARTEVAALATLTVAFDAFFQPKDEGVRSAPPSELERRSRCLGLARAALAVPRESATDWAREARLRAGIERARVLGCEGGDL